MRFAFELTVAVVLATLFVACGSTPNGHLRFELAFDGDPSVAAERVRERLALVDEREDVSLGEVKLEQTATDGLSVEVAVLGGAHCERFETARRAVGEALTKPEQLSLREVLEPDEAFIAAVKAALGEGVGVGRNPDPPYLDVSAPEGVDVAARVSKVATGNMQAAVEEVPTFDGGKPAAPSWRIWAVATQSELKDDDIEQARATFDSRTHRPAVRASLTAGGAQRFEALTARLTDKWLAILVDDRVMSVPKVMEPISGGQVQVTIGDMGRPEAEVLGEAQLLALGLQSGPIAKNLAVTEVTATCTATE